MAITRILMVCLGNICRSPLAHGILESKLPDDLFYVDSAGTSNYHIGQQPDRRSIAVARLHGIDISHQAGRQFSKNDFDAFDIIYAMDQDNYNDIVRLARTEDDIAKVRKILDADTNISSKNVPDPYYGDMSDFEHVFALLDTVCQEIADQLNS
ncbi:low molecular weight protein-tyrosine-phosphatase [Mangrovimonas sp. DI 80]|uniref:low molecular weight protein-tyrosine-phosphatase n=1 Tax=Mangrovimonas sp. DI 80 TaxID=1779330 RepID=UPI00097761A8|nr:low molecular weight protein-tyrosine-phosphatase [Mangrovimonas sp. DI 80]OMP29802.1 protein-tyrosine-phosphatase [Mangrovimonas sp. DI 80]